jgi:hypothetical protein
VPASAARTGVLSIGAAASASAINSGRNSAAAYALFDDDIEPHLWMDGAEHLERAARRKGYIDGLTDILFAGIEFEARVVDKDLVDVFVVVVDRQRIAFGNLDRAGQECPPLLRNIDCDTRAKGEAKRSERRQKHDDAASN